MKKIFALVLAIAMVATFAACGGAQDETPATAEYKLGVGTVVSLDESKDATAQADTTVATVVIDADGKIVACDLDVAQTKVAFENGKVAKLDEVDLRTKTEKGADYGMAAALNFGMDWNNDGVVKEWDAQAAEFEKFVIGKTADEVTAIKTKEVEGKGYIIADEADLLAAGCTIQITDFVKAVVAACKDDQAKTFTAAADSFKLGLDIETEVAESADATAKLYSDYSAVVVDADGKVLAAVLDAVQPSVTATADGFDKAYTNTKRGLKADYGMAAALNYGMDWNGDGVVKEWFEQSKVLTDYVVGKTADEIKAIETKEVEGKGYIIPADDELLTAGCTIQISSYKTVMANAIANAK